MRGVFSAKGPHSSAGGVPVENYPDDSHMEEEVQLKIQIEEEEIRERNKVRNRESRNGQPHNVDDHVDDMTRTTTFLSHAVLKCNN